MKAKHTADVSLLFGNKRNVKYELKKKSGGNGNRHFQILPPLYKYAII